MYLDRRQLNRRTLSPDLSSAPEFVICVFAYLLYLRICFICFIRFYLLDLRKSCSFYRSPYSTGVALWSGWLAGIGIVGRRGWHSSHFVEAL